MDICSGKSFYIFFNHFALDILSKRLDIPSKGKCYSICDPSLINSFLLKVLMKLLYTH